MKKVLIAAALVLSIGGPSWAQSQSSTTLAPDNNSPWMYYLIALVGVAAAPIASVMTARLSNKRSVAELQLEHAAKIQEDVQARMESWMMQQLSQKEGEIAALRLRIDELEKKIDELEDRVEHEEHEKRRIEERYNSLCLQYARLQSDAPDID